MKLPTPKTLLILSATSIATGLIAYSNWIQKPLPTAAQMATATPIVLTSSPVLSESVSPKTSETPRVLKMNEPYTSQNLNFRNSINVIQKDGQIGRAHV